MECPIELEEEHASCHKGQAFQFYEHGLDLKKRHALTVDAYRRNGHSVLGVSKKLLIMSVISASEMLYWHSGGGSTCLHVELSKKIRCISYGLRVMDLGVRRYPIPLRSSLTRMGWMPNLVKDASHSPIIRELQLSLIQW